MIIDLSVGVAFLELSKKNYDEGNMQLLPIGAHKVKLLLLCYSLQTTLEVIRTRQAQCDELDLEAKHGVTSLT